MQAHAAVFRDGPTLQAGCKKMSEVYKGLDNLKVRAQVWIYSGLCARQPKTKALVSSGPLPNS